MATARPVSTKRGGDLAKLLQGSDGAREPGPGEGDQVLDKGELARPSERRFEEGHCTRLAGEGVADSRQAVPGDIIEESAASEDIRETSGVHSGAGDAGVREAQVDGQRERRERVGGDGERLEVANDGGGAKVLRGHTASPHPRRLGRRSGRRGGGRGARRPPRWRRGRRGWWSRSGA